MNRISRRTLLSSVAAACGTRLVFPSALRAVDGADDPAASGAALINAQTQAAIDRGLAFLASRQLEDGAFGTTGYSRNVAICALAGLAFMSAGNMPGRGLHGAKVNLCIDFLLNNTQESGFVVEPNTVTHGPMYGHGFATLFLAEAYGMTLRPDMRDKLSKAVELIVNTQNHEGGWRYQPQRRDADISVTVSQVMALRAARNAGLHVPNETIERSIDYVKRCRNADGGFMYMAQGGASLFPRSAAGIAALYTAGIYEGPEIESGLAYLMQSLPRNNSINRGDTHYFYGHYYAVQAMWQAGGDAWSKWYPAIRDELVPRQNADTGAWSDQSICPEYSTAMACVILQMPNNYLPIFQR